MLFIFNKFPFDWIPNGTSLKKIGYVSAEKLKELIEEHGVVTNIDKITRDTITLFTGISVGARAGELRKFKDGDVIVIISIEESLLCVFEVRKD